MLPISLAHLHCTRPAPEAQVFQGRAGIPMTFISTWECRRPQAEVEGGCCAVGGPGPSCGRKA